MSRRSASLLNRALRSYSNYRSLQPAACRYLPTCSAYACEAVEVHGAFRGLWLTVRRVSRCHPLGGHGIDPVPASVNKWKHTHA